jgi:hypothetical protein
MADKDFVVKNGLVVDGTFNVNSTALYYGTGSTNTTINTTSINIGNTAVNSSITATTVAFNANSTTIAFYVAANGNIGLGNSTPSDKLRVEGTATFTANVTGPGTSSYLDGFFIDCGVYS